MEFEILVFKTDLQFEKWLTKTFNKCPGIWLRIFKKDSDLPTITYQAALEVALCYGWIDGQKKSYDEISWLQRFCPRGKKSIWSHRNTLLVERLIREKRMRPAGMSAVEAAKSDGRWDAAYGSPKNMKIPEDFLALLQENRKAFKFFETLNKSNKYAIGFRLHTAKKVETRARRMKVIIKTLAAGKKLV